MQECINITRIKVYISFKSSDTFLVAKEDVQICKKKVREHFENCNTHGCDISPAASMLLAFILLLLRQLGLLPLFSLLPLM